MSDQQPGLPQGGRRAVRQSRVAFGVVGGLLAVAGWVIWGNVQGLREGQPPDCDGLPLAQDAQRTWDEHADVRGQIEAIPQAGGVGTIINPSKVSLELNTASCPGKAFVSILYGTESQKKKIRALLGPDFFGMPYTLHNI